MKIKPIKNFPNYYISDTGIVYSNMRRSNQPKSKTKRILSQWEIKSGKGYMAVHLAKNKISYKKFVHRLVLEAFVCECPKKFQCRHLDGNSRNNNLYNLKWGTRSENQMDRLLHGTDNRGENHGMSKLKKEDIPKIRILAKKYNKKVRKIDNGGNYKVIAKIFNVKPSTIGQVIRGLTWSHVL